MSRTGTAMGLLPEDESRGETVARRPVGGRGAVRASRKGRGGRRCH